MQSPHSPDRVRIEVESVLGARLADRDYQVVASGPAGVSWRRERPLPAWIAFFVCVVLALSFGLGGASGGDLVAIVTGLVFAGLAYAVFRWRAPAVVVVHLRPLSTGGTEVEIEGGDGQALSSVVRSAVGAIP